MYLNIVDDMQSICSEITHFRLDWKTLGAVSFLVSEAISTGITQSKSLMIMPIFVGLLTNKTLNLEIIQVLKAISAGNLQIITN